MDVPKKHKERGKNQPDTDVEQYQAADGIQKQHKFPGEEDMIQNTKYKEYAKRQPKIDKSLDIFGKQKQIFWHIDFCEDTGVSHKGLHTLSCRFAEIGEDQVPTKKVSGVVWCISSEKLGENQTHDQ